MSYFIHFGCWNNQNCYKNNALSKVVNKISKLPDKTNLKFLSVCGDNYYPLKEKGEDSNKKKSYIKGNLISGFQCLRNSVSKKIPIYMTYGNHDFEMDNNFQNIDENCTITNDQIKISKLYDIKLQLWQEIDFNKNTKLIFIDTSIYDNNKICEYIKCYKIINDIYKTIDIIREQQNNFIKNIVQNIKDNHKISNIIIIGHHPLAYLKTKEKTKEKTKDKTKDKSKHETKKQINFEILNIELNNLLFNDIYLQLKNRPNINYYYLCADHHQYQCGNIQISNLYNTGVLNIKQYIVGTGGAKLDPYDSTLIISDKIYEQQNIKYYMNYHDITNSCSENGFLKCIQKFNNNIDFEFIKAESPGIPILTRLTSKKTKHNTITSRVKSSPNGRSRRKSQYLRRSGNTSYKSRHVKSI